MSTVPTVNVNGLDVYYEIHGDGPPLLNISGTGGDLRRMPPTLSPLTRSFTTLAYDQRGLGQTRGGVDREPTMADYADDAAGLMSELGWTDAHVVGTSFGGMVALNLAVRHPELVDRLVLCCTSPGGSHPSYPLHELLAENVDDVFATRMRLMDRRWDPQAAEPIPGLGPFYDQFAAEAKRTLSAEAAEGLRLQLMARAGHDVFDALASITAPTLVCAGRYDDLAPLENSQVLADRIPGARLEVFDGGHIFMIQDRTAFPMIIEFLTDIPRL
jgi:3-oxoadipate enol-lactonase